MVQACSVVTMPAAGIVPPLSQELRGARDIAAWMLLPCYDESTLLRHCGTEIMLTRDPSDSVACIVKFRMVVVPTVRCKTCREIGEHLVGFTRAFKYNRITCGDWKCSSGNESEIIVTTKLFYAASPCEVSDVGWCNKAGVAQS